MYTVVHRNRIHLNRFILALSQKLKDREVEESGEETGGNGHSRAYQFDSFILHHRVNYYMSLMLYISVTLVKCE